MKKNPKTQDQYNAQITVNSEYITGIDVFSDWTDYKTLGKFMNVLSRKHRKKHAKLVADAGFLRLCRSIQVEGAFVLLKNDFGFRRFLTTGRANVRTELLFRALAFDLKKCWMKRENGRMKTHLSRLKNA